MDNFPDRLKFSVDKIPIPKPIYLDKELYENINQCINQFQSFDCDIPKESFDEFHFHLDFMLFWLRSKQKFALSISVPMMMILEKSLDIIYYTTIPEYLHDDYGIEKADLVSHKLTKMIEKILALQNISSKLINNGYTNVTILAYVFMRLIGKINYYIKEDKNG